MTIPAHSYRATTQRDALPGVREHPRSRQAHRFSAVDIERCDILAFFAHPKALNAGAPANCPLSGTVSVARN